MALTLNTTLNDQYANSYADIAYCDAYWANHFSSIKGSQWAALSTAQKTGLLIAACRVIETARFTAPSRMRTALPLAYDRHSRTVITLPEDLVPTKWDWNQSLQFPRNLDLDLPTGQLFVPEPIMMAQCEQTVYTLNFDETAIANRMTGVVQDVTYVGNIHLRQNYVSGGTQFSPSALEMCRPFLLKTSYQVRRG